MTRTELEIDDHGAVVHGSLAWREGAGGCVVFAHGSGSSRFSPRNREVAATFEAAGVATLLFDLLSMEEQATDAHTAEFRFDIPRLARRRMAAIERVAARHDTAGLPIDPFGASTGAPAALVAAATCPGRVGAVVSRRGRPDLARDALLEVRAPTLLGVGALDRTVLARNRAAATRMRAPVEIAVVPGATHLCEEPGTLAHVSSPACAWCARHLDP